MNKKLKILEDVFGEYQTQRGEFLFYCPSCDHHKKKLSFNIDKNYFKCWNCLWSSKSIFWAIKKYGSHQQIGEWKELNGIIDLSSKSLELIETKPEEINIDLPDDFRPLCGQKLYKPIIKYRTYLEDRGLTHRDIIYWKIGCSLKGKYKWRIIIPSFNMEGKLNFFIARSIQNNAFIPYLNPPIPKDIIFNELFLEFQEPITLVEGVFDAIVAENAIPLLGSSLSENSYVFQKIVNSCSKVYLALDPDAYEKEQNIINLLLTYGVEVYKINVSPYKDVGEMSKTEFQKRKNEALLISKENDIEYMLKCL